MPLITYDFAVYNCNVLFYPFCFLHSMEQFEFYFLTRSLIYKITRSTFDNLELLKNGLPGAIVTALILGVHELSHILVAKRSNVKLGVPYFVPSWQVNIWLPILIFNLERTFFFQAACC